MTLKVLRLNRKWTPVLKKIVKKWADQAVVCLVKHVHMK